MANQTVYPYGTGGQLPASIGIVNDYVTGGADKALSAEMGKVFGEQLFNIFENEDLSSLPVNNYSLRNTDWYSAGKHIAPSVTPGDTIRLTAQGLNGYGGGLYAFMTSAYTPPTNTSTVPPYVSGGRQWLANGSIILVVPEGAAYLCLCTKDGAPGQTSWTLETLVSAKQVLDKDDIVNDLTTGGEDAPLSAEQGKVLNQKIVGDSIPSGLTKHEYSGPIVKVSDVKHYVATKQVSTITSIACQGGACFGDYLFMFKEYNDTCWIYNLRTSALLQTISIPSSERGFVPNCHCNTVNFGTEYYDANDPFPLIYVSTGYASGEYTGALVYRIVATTENDVTTYSLVLVQTLKMPGTDWTEFVTGEDGFCYLCYTTQRKIYRMKMPKLAEGDVTFNLEQALSTYQFTQQPSWYNGSYNQNRFYKDGKIYVVSGNTEQTRLFIVLNLSEEKREVEIDLNATFGLSGEPETCFIWQDHICIVFRSNNKVYALYFE